VVVATQRELAEAHSFVRRRLVTALVSGSPGGREVERPGCGRAVVGGVVLALLLMAVAAVSGVLARHPEPDGSHTGAAMHARRGGPGGLA
jgi:hypothetical protein